MLHPRAHTWLPFIRTFLRWTFGVSLVTYLGLFLIEDLAPGFVSLHFNLNLILQFAVGFGILTIWHQRESRHTHQPGPTKSQLWNIVIAIAAGLLVWYRIRQIGLVAVVIGLLSALIIFFLGRLLENEDNESKHPD